MGDACITTALNYFLRTMTILGIYTHQCVGKMPTMASACYFSRKSLIDHTIWERWCANQSDESRLMQEFDDSIILQARVVRHLIAVLV